MGSATEQRGSRMVWVAIVGGLAFVALAIIFASRFGSDPTVTASPLRGQPAPDAPISLMDGSGEISIADYAGDIVVVNFWASWCLGCRTEHAALMQAASDYEAFDTTFVAINYQDDPKNAEAFLDELGRSEVTVYTVDEGSTTAFEWGVLGLPETFFVDRDGIVVGKVSGPVSYGLLRATIDKIIVGDAIDDVSTGDVENR
ncbi:MAG: redoxin domain-containing protein [Acidimicrobiia bacterium]|nr:redoxin domain-containing protein [Acidimicrobiia bacterium]